MNKQESKTNVTPGKNITRKEALKTAGRYAAFTAAAALVLLSPLSAQTTSANASDTRSTERGRSY